MAKEQTALANVPHADAPCDARGCSYPWHERVEWMRDDGSPVVRFACKRHAYLYLMSARERLPKH